MSRLRRAAALAIGAGLVAFSWWQRAESAPPAADLILTNGRVYTVDPARPWAQAVAIAGDRLVAVGTAAEVAARRGLATRTIDLGGRLALPAFGDAHVHLLSGGLALQHLDLSAATSLADIQRRLASYARTHPRAAWIRGFGWSYSVLPGMRLPHRRDLDALVHERPVYLESYDGHTVWVNSRALTVAGITAASKAGGGEVVRDKNGAPTGVLKEDAIALVSKYLPAPTAAERRQALQAAVRMAHRFGIASAFEAAVEPEELAAYAGLTGSLRFRCALTTGDEAVPGQATLDRYRRLQEQHRGPWLRVPAVKYFVDGVIETRTSALLAPYAGSRLGGVAAYTPAQLKAIVERWDRAGFQVAMHATGDRAARMGLDAVAALPPGHIGKRRHRLEHIELVAPADLARFRQLDVIASMQPFHAQPAPGPNAWASQIGPALLAEAFVWRGLLAAGAPLAFGSDWNVADMDPIQGIATAVTRQNTAGYPAGGWLPAQRIRLEDAIRAYTWGAAYSVGEEQERGTITPGRLADLVVLSANLFRARPLELYKTRVLLTLVGGRVVYQAAGSGLPRLAMPARAPSLPSG